MGNVPLTVNPQDNSRPTATRTEHFEKLYGLYVSKVSQMVESAGLRLDKKHPPTDR